MRDKHPLFLIILFGLFMTVLQAQESSNTTGGVASGGNGSVSYSVGQIFFAIQTGTNVSIVEGVQQPYEISVETGPTEPVIQTQIEYACEFFYWNVTNEIYFESGLITEISSSGIFDTIYILDLNIGEITDYTILVNGGTISTTNNTASYQWLDCDDDYAPIAGATNQSYTPPSSGNFALELTEGACVDTTACVYVVPTSTTYLQSNTLSIYPNPTQDIVTINLDNYSRGILKTYDLQGRIIHSQPVEGQRSLDYTIEGEAGLYLIEFVDERGTVYVGNVVKM